jgi:hypothetical protein
MKINYAKQYNFLEILEIDFDIIICSSGFETRSTFFYQEYLKNKPWNLAVKFCFCFTDRKVFSKTINDIFFIENGFKLIEVSGITLNDTIDRYRIIFSEIKKTRINVLVDYSSMTKVMYAALIKYLVIETQHHTQDIYIYFSYTPSLFTEPLEASSNMYNQPIPLFPTVELTDKKIALLACLGYEEGKAEGLIEYLQIDNNDIYLFYTAQSKNDLFYEKIKEHNQYLIHKIPTDNQFQYELENVPQVFNLLESLGNYLISKGYRVIIAPLGPKVFSLISILLTVKYKDITILRVSDGIKGSPVDRVPDPNKSFIIIGVNFIYLDALKIANIPVSISI